MDIIDISVYAVEVLDLYQEQSQKRICIDTVTEMVQWTMQEIESNKKEQKMFVHFCRNGTFQEHRTTVQKKVPTLCGFPPVQLLERFSIPCEFNGNILDLMKVILSVALGT